MSDIQRNIIETILAIERCRACPLTSAERNQIRENMYKKWKAEQEKKPCQYGQFVHLSTGISEEPSAWRRTMFATASTVLQFVVGNLLVFVIIVCTEGWEGVETLPGFYASWYYIGPMLFIVPVLFLGQLAMQTK